MVVDVFTVEAVLAGLAGGALGAAIGGLPALSLAGLLVVVGEAADVLGRAIGEQTMANPEAFGGVGFTEVVGLGPALGPHVAFAGGVAAAAYAGRRGRVDADGPFHGAKDLTAPLGSAPDVLLAGGVFGVVGVLLARLAAQLAVPVDPVAFAVVVSGLGARLAFGYPLLGRIEGGLLDMTPFEREERRRDAGATAGRHVVEPWQPHHYEWDRVIGLGAAVGLLAAYLGVATGSAFLAFGVAAAILAFRSVGLDRVPIVYHVALPASVAALGLAGQEPWIAVIAGGVFGVVGAVLGELAQRTLFAHGDTYLDPAFTSILLTSLVLALLASVGVLSSSAVPYPTP